MKKQKKVFLIKMIMVILSGPLFGCGVSSNSSSTDSRAGAVESAAIQSMSPGELVRIQNQKIMSMSGQDLPISNAGDETPESQIAALYNGLSSSNPSVRKNSNEILKTLVNYDPQYLEELKKIEHEEMNPESRYGVSLIIKEAEKAKSREEAEEYKRQMEEIQAAESAIN